MEYFVYILRCRDNTLYTGMTNDLSRRMQQHLQGKGQGAKYTRSHPPRAVEGLWRVENRSAALKLEYRVKRLTRAQKEALIASPESVRELFPEITATATAEFHQQLDQTENETQTMTTDRGCEEG